jgi:phosphate transport system substrate-binding protein
MTAIHRPTRRLLLTQAAALAAPPARAAPAPVLRVAGTGAALAMLRLLAAAFREAGGDASPDILPSLGSSGGLRALQRRVIQIAVSSRPLTAAEAAVGLRPAAFARTAMAFATREGSRIEGVSRLAAAGYLSGERPNWPDGEPMRLVRRPPGEADWIALAGLGPEMERAVEVALRRPGLLVAGTDQENAELIEGVPGSFGLISQGQARAEARRVRLLALDGEMPTLARVEAGSWPMIRSLELVTPDDPGPVAAAFLLFAQGEEAAALMREHGFLPARDLRS